MQKHDFSRILGDIVKLEKEEAILLISVIVHTELDRSGKTSRAKIHRHFGNFPSSNNYP